MQEIFGLASSSSSSPPPPLFSLGEWLKILGSLWSLDQPIPIPNTLGSCRMGEFLDGPREPISSGLSYRNGEGFLSVTQLWCARLSFQVLCIYFHEGLWHLSTLQQQAWCARQKYQCHQTPYVSVLICSWLQPIPEQPKQIIFSRRKNSHYLYLVWRHCQMVLWFFSAPGYTQ